MKIIYPINIYNGKKVEKVLGSQDISLKEKNLLSFYFYLEKNIEILDDGLIFANNSTKIITNIHDYYYVGNPREEGDPLMRMEVMQSYKVNVKYT